MKVTVTQDTSWSRALDAARRTIGKEPTGKEPSKAWKAKALIAEHSPIKLVEYTLAFKDLKQRTGVHILRHEHLLPFIHSQRDDRNTAVKNSDELPQGTPNDQDFVVNAQTLINISRKRLCNKSAKDTIKAWQAVKDAMKEVDPVMASVMVRNCVYCGFCREFDSCGYDKTQQFREEVKKYRKIKLA